MASRQPTPIATRPSSSSETQPGQPQPGSLGGRPPPPPTLAAPSAGHFTPTCAQKREETGTPPQPGLNLSGRKAGPWPRAWARGRRARARRRANMKWRRVPPRPRQRGRHPPGGEPRPPDFGDSLPGRAAALRTETRRAGAWSPSGPLPGPSDQRLGGGRSDLGSAVEREYGLRI